MNRKIVGMLVVALFVASAFVGMAGHTSLRDMSTENVNLGTAGSVSMERVDETFSAPKVSFKDDHVLVSVENTLSDRKPNCPIMPYKSKVLTFPFGTKIDGIDVKVGNVQTMSLNKKIAPAPEATPLNGAEPKAAKEGAIYKSSTPYPSSWVEWNTGAGLENGKHVVFLSIHTFPARYTPSTNELEYVDNISIDVKYTPSAKPLVKNDVYDLLIVSPPEFKDALQPLVEHKEKYGVRTILVTTDEIYGSNYFPVQGRDDAEKIKYFIKDGIENWGIKYVLLVGGLKSLMSGQDWYIPVRYSHNSESGGHPEHQYISDLYYADIYDADGNFSSWDTNGNGIYGEWRFGGKDKIDGYPDVYVGRLACRNVGEVNTVVNKIITYESTPADPSWFKRLVLAGGDTFNDISGHNYLEGEVATQQTADYLSGKGFIPIKLWWSDGNLKQSNVVKEISKGAGFVHLSGHGSPGMWMTKDFTKDPKGKYILGLDVYHMPLLSNKGEYPVVVIGGCHNSMFNTTFVDSTKGCVGSITGGNPTWYWMPIPESFGWWIVKAKNGGAISSFGCTALGLGAVGDSNNDGIPDCIQYLLGWMEVHFFKQYGEENVDILGEMWGNTITGYNNLFPPMDDKSDLKTIQEWEFLGDPSLKIGGYSS